MQIGECNFTRTSQRASKLTFYPLLEVAVAGNEEGDPSSRISVSIGVKRIYTSAVSKGNFIPRFAERMSRILQSPSLKGSP